MSSSGTRLPFFNWRRALVVFVLCCALGAFLLWLLWLVGLYGNRYAVATSAGLACALSTYLSLTYKPLKDLGAHKDFEKSEEQNG